MAAGQHTATSATGFRKRFFRELLEHAVLAPSGHNTQPWLFRITEAGEFHLLADRTRALPVVDPHDRELTISCGAALDHLEVAAGAKGKALELAICPNRANGDLLAIARIAGESADVLRDLFDAIPERRTTRTKFEDRLLPEGLAEQCVAIAAGYGVGLTLVVDEELRSAVAKLVAEGDRIQFADPGFRRELASWVHSRRHASRDGMSGSGFGMPDILSPVGALVIRTFDLGNGVAASDEEKIREGSPMLAVFSTPADTASHWIQAGRALSRVLLTLAAHGATASYLNPPVEIAPLRTRLRSLVRCDGVPQLLMRFGYGPSLEPTARRPVDEVLLDDE